MRSSGEVEKMSQKFIEPLPSVRTWASAGDRAVKKTDNIPAFLEISF